MTTETFRYIVYLLEHCRFVTNGSLRQQEHLEAFNTFQNAKTL